ncbi:hypothetical protein QQX98_004177 [Neonectria punicea]|uniref:Methyltransferase type 11 domain-containing protein n=1 Tax=Neonectria punicea TaxID=979145 RepID=A0ABR1HB00_9HYPO
MSNEIEDCTREWTFASNSVDYIHMRWLVGSVPDWSALFDQAYRCCRPGGWFESLETSPVIECDDHTVKEDSAMGQWGKIFIEGAKKLGTSFTVVQDDVQKRAMEEAGFADIQEFDFKTPLGGWPKDESLRELGRYAQLTIESDIEGYVLFMANTLEWSKDEIQVYIAHLRREIRSGKHHGYWRQKAVWGRKPA